MKESIEFLNAIIKILLIALWVFTAITFAMMASIILEPKTLTAHIAQIIAFAGGFLVMFVLTVKKFAE